MLEKDASLIAKLRRKYGIEEAELHDSEIVRAGLDTR
ncbi:MAG: hypothetical protein QOG71_1865 [Pyrinomonadaceae bacterium]|nr:hypothetical protein [Pyrinomonadaceae bacterium]